MSCLNFLVVQPGLRFGKSVRGRGLPIAPVKRMPSRQLLLRSRASGVGYGESLSGMSTLKVRNIDLLLERATERRILSRSIRTSESLTAKGRDGRDNMRVAYYMAAVAVLVFGVSYASVPLYKGICPYFYHNKMSHIPFFSFLPDDWLRGNNSTHGREYSGCVKAIHKWEGCESRLHIHCT